jgi:hypothetical protein
MGIPVATYGSHERAQLAGGRDYGPDEARRYARTFGVTPEWLLTGLRQARVEGQIDIPSSLKRLEEPKTPKLPVMGYVGAGAEAHYYEVSQGQLDEIEPPNSLTEGTVIIDIRDHGLGSLFNRWLAFFGEKREPATPELIGCLCVVALEDNRIIVRQLQQGRTSGRYDLICEFGEPIMDVSVLWAAKVMSMLPP